MAQIRRNCRGVVALCGIAATAMALLACPRKVIGENLSSMYSQEALDRLKERYVENTTWNFERVVMAALTKQERATLKSVQLEHTRLCRAGDPFAYIGRVDKGQRCIVVPIFAIKFFDDLSTAEAWLTLNGFTTETIAEYVSILKYRRAEDFSEGRYPPPLTALHIPPEALKDRAVNERAQASLASIVVYLLSRELGFFYLGPSEIKATVLSTAHRPKAKLVMEQKGIHRSPEGARILQSDAFALEIMRRAGVPPTGLAIYFSAQAHWAPNEADFSSRQGYLHYWHSTPEYEVFSERLYQIASLMLDSRKEYARRQDDRDSSIRQIEQSARAIFRLHDVMEMSSVQQMENKRRALKQSTDDLQPRPKEGRN